MKQVTRERRSQARETPEPLGFIQISRDDGGRIRNISESGLCFEAFAPIERSRLLQFWFSLDLRERVEAKGRLAWLDPHQEIGGLQFLDLTPKARRHLRNYFDAHAEPQLVAHGDANPASQLAADFRAHVRKSSGEESVVKPKGNAFLAVLAKLSLGEAVSAPHASEAGALARAQAADSTSEATAKPLAPQTEVRPSFNPLSFVSLERHQNDSRRQLLRGVLLGGVLAFMLGAAGGWFLGRESALSSASPVAPPGVVSPSVPATPPISDVSAAPVRSVSSTSPSLTARSAPIRHAPGNPSPDASSPASRSTEASARQLTPGTPLPHDNGTKTAKKSATAEQLWASVQKGNMKAAVELADRFIQGDGVPVNCDQARVLLLVASEKNNSDAIKRLHDLDKTGCPPQ